MFSPVAPVPISASQLVPPSNDNNNISNAKLTLKTMSNGVVTSNANNSDVKPSTSSPAAINNNNNSTLNFSLTNNNNNNDSTIAGINAHVTALPIEQIKEIIKDQIDELRDEIMNENFKFKAEILKEFMYIKVSYLNIKKKKKKKIKNFFFFKARNSRII